LLRNSITLGESNEKTLSDDHYWNVFDK
jgi:hypothetical protein